MCILPTACTRLPTSDAARYTAALSSPDGYTAAAPLCLAITAAPLRGDCLVALMERWNHLDAEACRAISDPLWRDECNFTLSERLWAAGHHEEALSHCHGTRFVRQCGYHLLQREVEAATDADEPAPVAEARLEPFFQYTTRVPDAGLHFWSLWFRRKARLDRPVDAQDCSELASPRPCRAGLDRYLHEVLSAQAASQEDRCGEALPAGWVESTAIRVSVTHWQAQHCAPSAP